jgi:DNA-binding MarR family transcriptional regulator
MRINKLEVLYALKRESEEGYKRVDMETRVNWSDICRRIKVEHPFINSSSIPVIVSRILKRLVDEKLCEKKEIGRESLYSITPKGRRWLMANQEFFDKRRKWYEEPLEGVYLSYAVTPPEYGLIHEGRNDEKLKGKEQIEELINEMKEKNPDIETIIIRIDKNK